ncbi:hypothetical protein [uncultured Intestinimonas sp.]|nr:hypothetical protein [uncultured Intestinimonas sp.]
MAECFPKPPLSAVLGNIARLRRAKKPLCGFFSRHGVDGKNVLTIKKLTQ